MRVGHFIYVGRSRHAWGFCANSLCRLFYVGRKRQDYCSPKCSQAVRNERKRHRITAGPVP